MAYPLLSNPVVLGALYAAFLGLLAVLAWRRAVPPRRLAVALVMGCVVPVWGMFGALFVITKGLRRPEAPSVS